MADQGSTAGPLPPTRKVAQARKHVRRGQVQKTRVNATSSENSKDKQVSCRLLLVCPGVGLAYPHVASAAVFAFACS